MTFVKKTEVTPFGLTQKGGPSRNGQKSGIERRNVEGMRGSFEHGKNDDKKKKLLCIPARKKEAKTHLEKITRTQEIMIDTPF